MGKDFLICIVIVAWFALFIMFIYQSKRIVHKLSEPLIEKIIIKYNTDIDPIEVKPNSDWIDLRCAEDITMKKGESKLIPLGVAMQLPKGYEAHIAPRSSTFKNFGIIQLNSVGVVDESYCGDNDYWFYSAYALKNTEIHKGDRICQFRIVKKQPHIFFETTCKLSNEDRGGCGSTGKN